MTKIKMRTLQDKKSALTVNLLLDAACELAQTFNIDELSFKRVSEYAEISQRTMFRHFKTRDSFLDALTAKLYSELDLPEIPNSVDGLTDYIDMLYDKLDNQPRKVMVLLSADLLPRVLSTTAKQRFASLEVLLSKSYPNAHADDIKKTTANLRYVMSASSWRYYRMHFDFESAMAKECAQILVTQSIQHLAALNR